MKIGKFLLASFAMSLFVIGSASAQNLGTLSNDQAPQNLVPAEDFVNGLNSSTADVSGSSENVWSSYRHHGGWGSGWGNWWGGSYPSYYYPSYGYPYYYPYNYGYGYGYSYPYSYYYNNESADDHSQDVGRSLPPSSQPPSAQKGQPATEKGQTPVVCFSQDISSGNWFAQADLASNVMKSQDEANKQCQSSGKDCRQNMGCAIASNQR